MSQTIYTGLGEVEYVTVTITASVDIHLDTVQLAVGYYSTVVAVGTHPTWLTPDLLTFSADGKTATAKLLIGNGHVNPVAGPAYYLWWRIVDGLQVKIEPVKGASFKVTDTAGSTVAAVPPWVATVNNVHPDSSGNVTVAGGGGSFPDFTGSGSPEGVVTAVVGKSYVDTTNGTLYFKGYGTTSTTGWVVAGGQDPGVHEVGWLADSGSLYAIAGSGLPVQLTDHAAREGTGNGLNWNNACAADGAQDVVIILGPAGSQHGTFFNPDGTTQLPGDVEVAAGGVILHSPDGSKHRLKVADDGTLSTEVVV